jgi:uncharacterized membrane protein YhaH (DUF805 family)
MNFSEAAASGFRNYVRFSGRATRSEFWYWTLFVTLVAIAASILQLIVLPPGDLRDANPFVAIWDLAVFLPSLAMWVRRLHDIDRKGWWLLIILIPLIGIIVLIIWACRKGTEGPNRFGADPLTAATSA